MVLCSHPLLQDFIRSQSSVGDTDIRNKPARTLSQHPLSTRNICVVLQYTIYAAAPRQCHGPSVAIRVEKVRAIPDVLTSFFFRDNLFPPWKATERE